MIGIKTDEKNRVLLVWDTELIGKPIPEGFNQVEAIPECPAGKVLNFTVENGFWFSDIVGSMSAEERITRLEVQNAEYAAIIEDAIMRGIL